MAILSGFKSFERYLKVPSDDGNKYQLMSERTFAKDVIFDDGKNLNNKVDKINTELSKINTELSQSLYIVSFDSSTGTLTTKSADYAG